MTLSSGFLIIQTLIIITILTFATVSDLRTGKVTNRFLIVSLGLSFLVYAGYALLSGSLPWGESAPVYFYILNIILSFAASFGFFFADVWAPGDAKLFMVITLLYPNLLQAVPVGSIFPSLQIIVWMFSLGFGYVVINSAYQRWKQPKHISEKHVRSNVHFSWSQLVRMLMAYAVSLFMSIILSTYVANFYASNRTLCILVALLVCYALGQVNQKSQIFTAVAAFIGILLIQTSHKMILSFSPFAFIPVIIAVLIGVLSRGAQSSNYTEVTADQMHAGMILSLYTYARYPDHKILPPARIIERRLSRLNHEQAEAIATWARRKGEPILIVKTIPFAPFIAAGTILELTLGWLRLYR